MKDWYPELYSSVLPRCSHSVKCIQHLEEIDGLDREALSGWIFADQVEEIREKEQVIYLARHLQYCYICQVAVGNERRLREQQRLMLHTFFVSEGTRVPSSTAAILASLNDDYPPDFQMIREIHFDRDELETEKRRAAMLVDRKAHYAQTWGATSVLALVVVLVLASLHMFMQFDGNSWQVASVASNKSTGKDFATVTTVASIPVHAALTLHTTDLWSSVILTRWSQDDKHLIVENYNPANKKSMQLLSTAGDTVVDNVSHKGDNLIYHTYDNTRQVTQYSLLSGEQYVIGGHGSNAVWSTDDTNIFLATSAGIIWKVDVNDPRAPLTKLFLNIHVDRLVFYRNHFLYYVRGQSLYRLDVDNLQQQEQPIIPDAASSSFWMAPNSEDIYYVKKIGTQREMYKHQDNTPSSRDFPLHITGTPVGYTQESSSSWSLMYINWNQATGGFDLQKTSSPKPVYQNIVGGKSQALCNIAASSGSICDNSLVMSPSGMLITVGRAMGTLNYQLWAINLAQKETTLLPVPTGKGPIQLIGWDKWLVD